MKRSRKVTSAAPHAHHKDPVLTHELLDLLAVVAHQLRTPLSIIKGYVAMLIDGSFGKISPSQKKAFETIYTSSERMIRLVNNFLDLPRIHVGLMTFNIKEESLVDILTHAIAEARMQADIKKIPIIWEAPLGETFTVKADRENLLQAFANIFDNAIKYTKHGSLTVSLKKTAGGCRVTITDTGIGIGKKDLPRIFDKFLRGGGDIRKEYREGRGLGLYIAKQIIEGHGGKIWAESEGIGKGSAFFIELPTS